MSLPQLELPKSRSHLPSSGAIRSKTLPARKDVSLAVVTMTKARTAAESRAIESSLRMLSRLNLPIFIGEGGSASSFVERVSRLPHVCICSLSPEQKMTLINQLGIAFEKAGQTSADFILYTEPDKRSFFIDGVHLLVQQLENLTHPAPGLIIAARSEDDFATFPSGQRAAETIMNELYGEALGVQGDYTYGPMLIHKELLKCFRLVPEEMGWGWRFYMMAIARQLGRTIHLCAVPGPCPPAQRSEDRTRSRRYRLGQLLENVSGLANGWIGLLDPAWSFESAD